MKKNLGALKDSHELHPIDIHSEDIDFNSNFTLDVPQPNLEKDHDNNNHDELNN